MNSELFPIECDVAVIGGGPAASLLAIILARRDITVVQFLGSKGRIQRPMEILSPPTILFLDKLEIGSVNQWGVMCCGVVRQWAEPSPDFFDYRLFNTIEARAIYRSDLQNQLACAAKISGVNQIHTRAFVEPENSSVVWKSLSGDPKRLVSGCTFVGTGRSSNLEPFPRRERRLRTDLIAFAMPWERTKQINNLAIEATTDGWWYSSPAQCDDSQLVFVTHKAVLQRQTAKPRQQIKAAYENCELMQQLGEKPIFDKIIGMDAHAGDTPNPIKGCVVAIGDTAISLDPLSGSGILCALEGAYVAAQEYLESGRIGQSYREWFDQTIDREYLQSREQYREATKQFPHSGFWKELST